jgi:hypothetical protein
MLSPEKIASRQAEQAREDDAGRIAAATPLPGATFDAFAQLPDMKVGPYAVRQFCDADFEALQILGSPLQKMMATAYQAGDVDEKVLAKEESEILKQVSRGQHAWDIAFIMTTTVEEVDAILRKDGAEGLKRQAAIKFGKLRLVALVKVIEAAIEQMSRSWDTRLAYEPAKNGGSENGEVASSDSPPQ